MGLKSNTVAYVFAALTMFGSAACEGDKGQSLPVLSVGLTQNDLRIPLRVEVAATLESREKGLMFRKDMPESQGMLFIWPSAQPRSFWMKNTLLPLDMLFLRERTVVAVIPWARPMDETPLSPAKDADMVLEVNGGWVSRHGISVGATLEVSGALPDIEP